jgi:cell division protein FtsA
MDQSKIIVGLEIGTTKTCMVVGEIRPDCSAVIIGGAEVASAGISGGEIRDMSMARQTVFDVWQKTQEATDVEIFQVLISVTGDHIQGESNVGSLRLPDNENVVDHHHMNEVVAKAKQIEITSDRDILHQEVGNFNVDGRQSILYATGISARTLDIKCFTIHGIATRILNSSMCARQIPLNVTHAVFAGLASAQAVLTKQQKEAGALLIDIGGGSADYICYEDIDIVACGSIPKGGAQINQDIVDKSGQRHMSLKAAEHFKCKEGNAFGEVKDTTLARYVTDTGTEYVIERGRLNEIIRDRLASILLQIKDKIPASVWNRSGMTVYLSGGTSLMRGLDNLAQFIFKVPVKQPLPPGAGEEYSYLSDPRYCTAIGLIRHAQRIEESKPGWFRRIINYLFGNN